MAKNRSAFKAGLFMVITFALIIGIVLGIKGISKFLDPVIMRTAMFRLEDDLSGLRIGDDVRIGGYKVGEVRNVELVPGGDKRLAQRAFPSQIPGMKPVPLAATDRVILVTFAMPKKYEVHEGARLRIQSNVTPGAWINFEYLGDFGKPTLADSSTLVGLSGSFTSLVSSLSEMGPAAQGILKQVNERALPQASSALLEAEWIMQDVRKQTIPAVNRTVNGFGDTAETARALLADVRRYLNPIVDKYYAVADSTKGMMDQIESVFGATETDFRGTMANLRTATGTLSEAMPGMMFKVNGILSDVGAATGSARLAMEDIRKTADNTRLMTAAARSVLVGNKSKIDNIIVSLDKTATNLKGGTADVLRNPWKILYKPTSDDRANAELFNSARQFSDGASDLRDAAQALNDALKDKEIPPHKLEELIGRLDKTFGRFNEFEKQLWENVKE